MTEIGAVVNAKFDYTIELAVRTIVANGNTSWTGKELRQWLEDEGFRIVKAPKAE
jgi:hypothetical protein